jgi:hypothetical protein
LENAKRTLVKYGYNLEEFLLWMDHIECRVAVYLEKDNHTIA